MSVRAHLLLDWDHFLDGASDLSGVRVLLAQWRQRHPRIHLTLFTSAPQPPGVEQQDAIADSWICGSGTSIFLKSPDGTLQLDENHQEVLESLPSEAGRCAPQDELLALDVIYLATQDLTPRPRLLATKPDRYPTLHGISDHVVAWPNGGTPRVIRGLDAALRALETRVRSAAGGASDATSMMRGG